MSEKEQLLKRLNNVELLELAKSVARVPIDSRTTRTELVRIVRGSLSVEEIRRKKKEIRATRLIQVKKRNKFLAILLVSVIAYSSLVIGSAAVLDDLSHKERPPEEKWSKTLYGLFTISAQETSDGGYIIAGVGVSPDNVSNTCTWLVKTDSEGNTQWNRTITERYASSVHQTSDGGYIIGGPMIYQVGVPYSWLVKTDLNGTVQWSNDHVGSVNSSISSVQQTSDGGYIIAGAVRPSGSSHWVFCVRKTDQNGNTQWNMTGITDGYASSAQETPDGGYIIAASASHVIRLVKTDSNGQKQWTGLYEDDQATLDSTCLQQTSDGGFAIGGCATSSKLEGTVDFWLAKINSNGTMQWSNTYGGNDTDLAYSIQETHDRGYILAGDTMPQTGGSRSVMLVKTDPNGKMQWSKVYGQTVATHACLIQQTSEREYTIVGLFFIMRVEEPSPSSLLVVATVLLTVTGLSLASCLVLIRRRIYRSMEE